MKCPPWTNVHLLPSTALLSPPGASAGVRLRILHYTSIKYPHGGGQTQLGEGPVSREEAAGKLRMALDAAKKLRDEGQNISELARPLRAGKQAFLRQEYEDAVRHADDVLLGCEQRALSPSKSESGLTQRWTVPETPKAEPPQTESVRLNPEQHGVDDWRQKNWVGKRVEPQIRSGDVASEDIQLVDSKQFKRLCRLILERLGYSIIEDGAAGPRSKPVPLDFLVSGNEGRIVVLCAAYHNRAISVAVVKQLVLSVAAHSAQGGMLITSGRFSPPAIEHAEAMSALGTTIKLIDRGFFAEMAARADIDLTDGGQPLLSTYRVSDAVRSWGALGSYMDGVCDSSPRPPSTMLEQIERRLTLRPSFKVTYDVEAAVRGRGRDGVIDRISVSDGTMFLDGVSGAELDESRATFFTALEPTPFSAANFRELHPAWHRFELDAAGAARKAKERIASHHATTGHWWGNRGNVYYGTWQPSARDITLKDIALVYLPENHVRFRILKTVYELEFLEHPSGRFEPLGNALFECRVCGQLISRKPLLCNACGKIAHRRKHGFKCKTCKKTVCQNCVRLAKGFLLRAPICPTCYRRR